MKQAELENCDKSRLAFGFVLRINSEQMLTRELIQVTKIKELESLLTMQALPWALCPDSKPEKDDKMELLSIWSDSNIFGLDLDLEILLKRS